VARLIWRKTSVIVGTLKAWKETKSCNFPTDSSKFLSEEIAVFKILIWLLKFPKHEIFKHKFCISQKNFLTKVNIILKLLT